MTVFELENYLYSLKNKLNPDEGIVFGDGLSKISGIQLSWTANLAAIANAAHQANLLRHAPDAFIAGETDSYAMHFAADSGVYLIETGHEISENIGIRKFRDKLGEELPGIRVTYFENKPPFRLE